MRYFLLVFLIFFDLEGMQPESVVLTTPQTQPRASHEFLGSFLEAYIKDNFDYDLSDPNNPQIFWKPIMSSLSPREGGREKQYYQASFSQGALLLTTAEKKYNKHKHYHKKIVDKFFMKYTSAQLVNFENPSFFATINHGFGLFIVLQLERLKEYVQAKDVVFYEDRKKIIDIKEWRKNFRKVIHDESLSAFKQLDEKKPKIIFQKSLLTFLLEKKIEINKQKILVSKFD